MLLEFWAPGTEQGFGCADGGLVAKNSARRYISTGLGTARQGESLFDLFFTELWGVLTDHDTSFS